MLPIGAIDRTSPHTVVRSRETLTFRNSDVGPSIAAMRDLASRSLCGSEQPESNASARTSGKKRAATSGRLQHEFTSAMGRDLTPAMATSQRQLGW
jgi:hypothetical protein